MHTAISVHSWFEEHEDALQHLLWPAQSPGLNINEQLLSVLESRVRSRFPPPTSLKQPDDVLEDKYSIQLKTIQSLFQEGYKLYYGQMVAQFRINREMCIFHYCFNYFVHILYVCMYVLITVDAGCVAFVRALWPCCEPLVLIWLLRFVYENVFCCLMCIYSHLV